MVKRIHELPDELLAADLSAPDTSYVAIDIVGDLSYKMSSTELAKGLDISPEYAAITVVDPEVDAQVIAAIRVVSPGATKAKGYYGGTATNPQYAWELSETDELVRIREPHVNLAYGTMAVPSSARSIPFGSQTLAFTGLASMTIDSSFQSESLVLPSGANAVTVEAPAGLGIDYTLDLWATLPTGQQVTDNEHFATIDDSGVLGFAAPPERNLTTGDVSTAVANRSLAFGGNDLALTGLGSMTIDSSLEATSIILPSGAESVTISSPTPLIETYAIELWDQLPTAQQVSDGDNFVRISDSGVLTFDSGGATDLDVGTTTGTTMEITSSTGTAATLPVAIAGVDAGLLSAADKTKIDTLLTNSNLTTGTVLAPTSDRVTDFGSHAWQIDNLTSMTIDSSFEATSFLVRSDLHAVTVTPPPSLTAAYPVELWNALPTAQQVSDGVNYVTINDSGKLSFAAGGATDLDVGTTTGTTMLITSSTGTGATLPVAIAGIDAGLMSAADKTKLDSLIANSNLTTGTVLAAEANRQIDFDTHSLAIVNLTTMVIDSSFEAPSFLVRSDLHAVTITPPPSLSAAYPVELWNALPTAQQVADNENYVTIDDAGKLAFGVGGGPGGGVTNISEGTKTAVSVEVVSSDGSNGILTAASDTQAGVLTAAQKIEIDKIAAKLEGNLTTGVIDPAEDDREVAFGGFDLDLINLNAASIDAALSLPSVIVWSAGSGSNSVTITSPVLAASYGVQLWNALPTAQQVSDNDHYVTIDDSGDLSFGGLPEDVSVTRGTLLAAQGNRSVDLGGFDITFTNINLATFACPVVADTYTGQSIMFEEGADAITLEPPIGLSNTYSVKLMTALPSGAQVTADENFLRIDDQGQLVFSAAIGSGSGTNLSAGVVTGTTYEIVSSSGGNIVLPSATTDDSGLMSAAHFDLVQTIPLLPIGNLTKGTMATATNTRAVDFGNQVVSFANAAAFLVTNSSETISYAAGDVNLTASGDINLTVGGKVNASAATVHVGDIDIGAGLNKITLQKPGALAAPYSLTLLDGLPSAGDVSSGINFLVVDDSGVMTATASTEVNITTGSPTAAAGNRSIAFGGNMLDFTAVSAFGVTDGTGTSIDYSSGTITLMCTSDLDLSPSGIVNASGAEVHAAQFDIHQNSQTISITAPAALAGSYTVEWLDDLPSVGDVASSLNYLRIDQNGKMSVGAGGGGGAGASFSITVADITERDTLTPTSVGFICFVEENQTTYSWNGSGWDTVGALAVGTATERAALANVPDRFIFKDITDGVSYRYLSSASPKWIQIA